MKPLLFDIHSHLNFPNFNNDQEEVIKRMQKNGIWTICVGADRKTSRECVELAGKYDCIFASVGIHPSDNVGNSVSDIQELARHPKVVAIGECGIDLKYQKSNLKSQKDLFIKQIELALELDKPLMIHCREAHDDLINILNSYFSIHNSKLRGNIHFFSGTWKQAQKYFSLGFTISFAGTITFTNQYDEIIKNASLDKIMIETDAPFAAPVPHRGNRNEPLYVREIAKKIAEVRGITFEEVEKITTENALRFFNLF